MKMDKRQLSHDILNALERLRIMHDLIRDDNYEHIPREELLSDLSESLEQLKMNFEKLSQ
jgi:hypothetical protein